MVSHWTWCLIISKQCWLNCELLAPLCLCSFLSLCSYQCASFYHILWESLGSKFRSLKLHGRTLMPGTSHQSIMKIFIWQHFQMIHGVEDKFSSSRTFRRGNSPHKPDILGASDYFLSVKPTWFCYFLNIPLSAINWGLRYILYRKNIRFITLKT